MPFLLNEVGKLTIYNNVHLKNSRNNEYSSSIFDWLLIWKELGA